MFFKKTQLTNTSSNFHSTNFKSCEGDPHSRVCILFGNPEEVIITDDEEINKLLALINSYSKNKYYCDEELIFKKRFLIFKEEEKVHTLYKHLGGFEFEAVLGFNLTKESMVGHLEKYIKELKI